VVTATVVADASRLNVTESGDRSKPPIVLLHGILGSATYWRGVTELLPGSRVMALDLLGYGASPRPDSSEYDYDDHVAAVLTTLDGLDIGEPVTLVGHSMGALIALRLAAEHPERVSKLILLGMPIFGSPTEARAAIGSSRIRRALLYGHISRLFCRLWCQALNPLSRRLAPLYLRTLPAAVASATVDHSWPSYSRSLINVVEHQDVEQDLGRASCPTLIVHGDDDRDAHVPSHWQLPPRTQVASWPGSHQLPLERPHEIADLLAVAQAQGS
jgi:pimeloyl-ACP methyl ester carboxylesterase